MVPRQKARGRGGGGSVAKQSLNLGGRSRSRIDNLTTAIAADRKQKLTQFRVKAQRSTPYISCEHTVTFASIVDIAFCETKPYKTANRLLLLGMFWYLQLSNESSVSSPKSRTRPPKATASICPLLVFVFLVGSYQNCSPLPRHAPPLALRSRPLLRDRPFFPSPRSPPRPSKIELPTESPTSRLHLHCHRTPPMLQLPRPSPGKTARAKHSVQT